MKTVFVSLVVLAVSESHAIAEGQRHDLLGTHSSGVVPGITEQLDTDWSLCIGLDKSVVWTIEELQYSGTVISVDDANICIRMGANDHCFSVARVGKKVTLSNATGERNGKVQRDSIKRCLPNAFM